LFSCDAFCQLRRFLPRFSSEQFSTIAGTKKMVEEGENRRHDLDRRGMKGRRIAASSQFAE